MDMEPDAWVIEVGRVGAWREVSYKGQPAHLVVRMCFAQSGSDAAVAGFNVQRTDGGVVTSRDIRAVRMPPPWVLQGEARVRWLAPGGEPVTRIRRGPKPRSDEQHREVWDLWRRATKVAPHAPVRWMLPQLTVSDATARRWVQQARRRAAELGWETDGSAHAA